MEDAAAVLDSVSADYGPLREQARLLLGRLRVCVVNEEAVDLLANALADALWKGRAEGMRLIGKDSK